jgi:hypothetical protein
MPRITNELSRARDEKAYLLFLQKDSEGKSTKSPKDVNDQLEVEDGFRMGVQRLYQLRDAAVEGKPIPAKASKARSPEEKVLAKATRKAQKVLTETGLEASV